MQTDWTPADHAAVKQIMELVPSEFHLLTSCFAEARAGIVVRFVQRCGVTPPMLAVAVEKGQPISPIVRDSRAFAVCVLDRPDPALRRHFSPSNSVGDPFLGLACIHTPSGCPVPARAIGWFDCELVRHLDVESDHEIYFGMVHHAARRGGPTASISAKVNGNGNGTAQTNGSAAKAARVRTNGISAPTPARAARAKRRSHRRAEKR